MCLNRKKLKLSLAVAIFTCICLTWQTAVAGPYNPETLITCGNNGSISWRCSSGSSGTLTPQTIDWGFQPGDTLILTFLPDKGYAIHSILVDNVEKISRPLATYTYIFSNLQQGSYHTLSVSFIKILCENRYESPKHPQCHQQSGLFHR